MKHTPWWLWTSSTFVIITGWLFFAPVFSGAADRLIASDEAWAGLLVDLSGFIPFFLATPLVWRYLLGRSVRTLLARDGHPKVRRLSIGFIVWLALCAASTAVDALLNPGGYSYTFSATRFWPFALVTLLLLPVQTWAEEFFFRGWILNWASALPRLSQVFISGIVFAWPHLGNPEAASDTALALTAYFLLGAGWAYASVRSGGIELALGAHLANNAFSLLIVGYDDGALPNAALFATSALDMTSTVISLAFMVPVFAYLTRGQSTVEG